MKQKSSIEAMNNRVVCLTIASTQTGQFRCAPLPAGYAGHYGLLYHTKSQSKVYRDGKEEATQSYNLKVTRSTIRRGVDDDANKGRRMTGNASRRGAYRQ